MQTSIIRLCLLAAMLWPTVSFAESPKNAQLFITSVQVSGKRLTAVQLAWLPGRLLNVCMGRSLYGCQTYDYEHPAKPDKVNKDIPASILTEWIAADDRYGAYAAPLLAEVEKLPDIASLIGHAAEGIAFQQDMPSMHIRLAISGDVVPETDERNLPRFRVKRFTR